MRRPFFHEKVGIPVHGGDAVEVDFEFKHRTRTEFAAFCKEFDERTASAEGILDVDVWFVMQAAVGWELPASFNTENVKELLQNYQGAAKAIGVRYAVMLARRHADEDVAACRRQLRELISPPLLH